MIERITYNELKEYFFFDAYRWCSDRFDKGKIFAWNTNFHEWGGALDTFDSPFDSTIEHLMINVIFIITNGARHILSHQIAFSEIQTILAKNNLNYLLKDLNLEEKKEFLYDLNLILNNREIEMINR
ncbi:hypothetical protein NYR30_02330 [Gallibacterium salpingitidis]|uniref:hypothetical protein n=1 Tax=Gallibacterium salpingitidis TaxID=505341 RepID=UPI00266F99AA|nr:hypothetical protein [Gallibacterium salpingitidis]WKT00161.1 hypothetical protein NYR30_02330 [Gallibacterium salpingitidis]